MKTLSPLQLLVGGVILVVIGTAIGARLARPPAGADITEGDSPLYKIAVDESIKGLDSKKDDKKDAAACSGCGKVHASPSPVRVAPPAAVGTNAVASAPGAAKPCSDCGGIHPPVPAGQGTPCPNCGKVHHSPQGVLAADLAAHSAPGSSEDYIYCAKCKVYHPNSKGRAGLLHPASP